MHPVVMRVNAERNAGARMRGRLLRHTRAISRQIHVMNAEPVQRNTAIPGWPPYVRGKLGSIASTRLQRSPAVTAVQAAPAAHLPEASCRRGTAGLPPLARLYSMGTLRQFRVSGPDRQGRQGQLIEFGGCSPILPEILGRR